MDQLERAHLDDDSVVRAHDGRAGNGRCAGADQEFATSNHETLPCW